MLYRAKIVMRSTLAKLGVSLTSGSMSISTLAHLIPDFQNTWKKNGMLMNKVLLPYSELKTHILRGLPLNRLRVRGSSLKAGMY